MMWNKGGIMNWLEAKPGEIDKCNEKAKYVGRALTEVANSGKPCVFTGEFIRQAWRFQYNPEKDQSSESEWEKYLQFIKHTCGIHCKEDEMKDEFYFFKDPDFKPEN